ncbi:hypothetical protein HYDPIDRAFT_102297, partial [Hydnomerulius pinastri MD-312]
STHTYLREGRAIHRLVSLVDPIEDLIAENDRRVMLGAESEEDAESIPSSNDEQRTYRSYKKLTRWCPSIGKLVNSDLDGHEMTLALRQASLLKSGADGARGDDASSLKGSVATWVNEQCPNPDLVINTLEKHGRGFNNDATGRLLCPVDYNWEDTLVHAAIREYHPDFSVTGYSWPMFLYPKGHYDPGHPSKGLFKGELLLRAFRCIFTSPSSALAELEADNDNDNPRPSGVPKKSRSKRTRCDVASLLKMKSVRFALSSCRSWDVKDEDFDHELFYHFIVDYFELPASREKAVEVDSLLLWWNRKVFGRRHASSYRPQQIEKLSVALSKQ